MHIRHITSAHATTITCTIHANVYMYCIGIIAIRLVGGSTYNEGRLEVKYNGEWGTVCGDGWSYRSAYVVCKQLGLGTYRSYYRRAYFGQGKGPIWLDNVVCTGSETTLARCSHLGINITRSCSHYEDIGLRCYGNQGIVCTYIYIM